MSTTPGAAPQGRYVVALSAYAIAETYLGLEEVEGAGSNPLIVGMLKQDAPWLAGGDEIPWCAAFVNHVAARIPGMPRSKKLNARSWLAVGQDVRLPDAKVGFDVVVLSRGVGAPGANVLDAPGHVGFYGGWRAAAGRPSEVLVLGGNQGDAVTAAWFPAARILGIRRCLPPNVLLQVRAAGEPLREAIAQAASSPKTD